MTLTVQLLGTLALVWVYAKLWEVAMTHLEITITEHRGHVMIMISRCDEEPSNSDKKAPYMEIQADRVTLDDKAIEVVDGKLVEIR